MSIDQEIDPRRELYLDFKNKLSTGDNDMFYDRDDLLDIYTYADDEGDIFIMLESVYLSERLYPGDEDFTLRKALTFDLMGMREDAQRIACSVQSTSTYARLVKLQIERPAEQEAVDEIEKIIADAASLDEDATILICDILGDNKRTHWLLRRLDTIKEKFEYLPTLYYELAMNLSDDFEYVKAMEMVEELVDLEPMKSEFWELYAEIAYRMADFEKTITGADFSLAINAESRRAALLKGAALLMRGEYREGRQLIGNLYLDPTISTPHTACLLAASYDDNPKKAVKILTDFLDTQSVLPQEPVTMLAQIDYEASLPYIKQYIRENAEAGETHFLIWADEFSSIGADDVVGFILDQYDLETFDVTKSPSFYDTIYYNLYKGGQYMRVIKKYGSVSAAIFSPIVHIAYVLSVFRIGGAAKALEVARETLTIVKQVRPYSSRYFIPLEAVMRDQFISRRLEELISTFKTAVDTGVAPDISKIDPFSIPTDDAGF